MSRPHPGYVLGLWIDSHNHFKPTQQEVADALGTSRLTVSQLLNEKRSVTADMALSLEKLTKIAALVWLTAQMVYDLEKARSKEKGKSK